MGNETSAPARLSPIHSRHWTPPAAARDAYNIDTPSFVRTLAARLGFHLICITRPCSHLFDGFNIVDAVGGALLLSLLLTAIALVSRRHRRAAAASGGDPLSQPRAAISAKAQPDSERAAGMARVAGEPLVVRSRHDTDPSNRDIEEALGLGHTGEAQRRPPSGGRRAHRGPGAGD